MQSLKCLEMSSKESNKKANKSFPCCANEVAPEAVPQVTRPLPVGAAASGHRLAPLNQWLSRVATVEPRGQTFCSATQRSVQPSWNDRFPFVVSD